MQLVETTDDHSDNNENSSMTTDIEQLLLQPLDCLQACMCSVQK